jgi:hypothetical protein
LYMLLHFSETLITLLLNSSTFFKTWLNLRAYLEPAPQSIGQGSGPT